MGPVVHVVLMLLLLSYGNEEIRGQTLDQVQDPLSVPARNVLVIYSFHHDLPWQKSFRNGLVSGFEKDGRLNYYEEILDSSRFPGPEQAAAFAGYLSQKYQDVDIDIVLTESEPASELFVAHKLFLDVPHLMVNPSLAASADPNQIVLVTPDEIERSFAAILDLRDSKDLYVIAETVTPFVDQNLQQLRMLVGNHVELNVHYLVNLSMGELLEQVRDIPKSANIFYLSVFEDGEGHRHIPRDVAEKIAGIASAPVFTHYDSMIGTGVLGGFVSSSVLAGEMTVNRIREIEALPIESRSSYGFYQHIYDQVALDRFEINVNDLPDGSHIVNQQRSVWTEYRTYVIAAGVVISVLAVLALVLVAAYRQVIGSRQRLDASRRQLERAQSIAHIGSWQWSAESLDVDWSDEVYRIFGLNPGASLTHDGSFKFVRETDRTLIKKAFSHSLIKSSPIDLEFEIVRGDGVERLVHLRGYKVATAAKDTRIEGTLHDITERRELQNNLFTAQRLKSVGQFAGGMAHHFNNMFAVILGNTELLAADSKDRADAGLLNNIVRSTKAAAALNEQLIAFSKNQSFPVEDFDLSQHVGLLKREMELRCGTGIEIEIDVENDLWLMSLNFDEFQVALFNISKNSVEAMGLIGRVTLGIRNVILNEEFVRINAGSKTGEYVCVSVEDNGTGMSHEIRDRAFDPFFTTKEVGFGAGLGLSVVYGFMRQLNGYAQVESEPGIGTTVSMYFPRS